MSQHTKGPWTAIKSPDGYTRIRCAKGAEIALMGGENMLADNSSAAANARLISAAPDLLVALIDATDALAIHAPDSWVLNQARAAIAKATGEQA